MQNFTFSQTAEETAVVIKELKADLLKFMGGKALRSLKKDPEFLAKVKEIEEMSEMLRDMEQGAKNDREIKRLLDLI